MMTRHLIYLVLSYLLFCCSPDHFYKEIDLSQTAFEEEVAVQAIYKSNNSTLFITLSKTQPIDDNFVNSVSYSFALLNDQLDTLASGSCQECNMSQASVAPGAVVPDKEYTLYLDVEGKDDLIYAKAKLSDSPSFDLRDINQADQNEVGISFAYKKEANSDDQHIYIQNILVRSRNNFSITGFYPDEEYDPYFDYVFNYDRVFRTTNIPGEEFLINTREYANINAGDTVEVSMIVENWSKALLDYGISIQSMSESEYNPFVEPATIRSNFEGARGVFALVQVDSFTLERVF